MAYDSTNRPAVGAKAIITDFSDVREEEGGFRFDREGEFQYLQSDGFLRLLQLQAFGDKIVKGAKAVGIESIDSEIVILRFTPAESDAEAWVIDGTNLVQGAELDLRTVEFTRVV